MLEVWFKLIVPVGNPFFLTQELLNMC